MSSRQITVLGFILALAAALPASASAGADLSSAVGRSNVGTVLAGSQVDPTSLTPEPPPGATCFAVDSASVICNTVRNFPRSGERMFALPCGPVFETNVDHRDGVRWYVHNKLARRFVHGRLSGTWSRSKAATGKVVKLTANWSSWTVWATHGDDDTALETSYGLQFRATASGLGNAVLWFGRVDPDNSSHGIKLGFRADAQSLTADANIDDADLNPAAIAALTRVLC